MDGRRSAGDRRACGGPGRGEGESGGAASGGGCGVRCGRIDGKCEITGGKCWGAFEMRKRQDAEF